MSQPTFYPSYDELRSAIDGKDKEIAELREKIGTDFMAGVVIEHENHLAEARRLIEHYSRLAGDDTSDCKKWLEGKP